MKTLNKKGLERKKFIYHSSKIIHARWPAKWPSVLKEHSLGGAAFRKELGGAAAETTSGESMVPGLHYNRMLSSALTKLRSLPGMRV